MTEVCVIEDKTTIVVVASYRSVSRIQFVSRPWFLVTANKIISDKIRSLVLLQTFVRRTNFRVSSGEKNSISIWPLHMCTTKSLDLTQINYEALITFILARKIILTT